MFFSTTQPSFSSFPSFLSVIPSASVSGLSLLPSVPFSPYCCRLQRILLLLHFLSTLLPGSAFVFLLLALYIASSTPRYFLFLLVVLPHSAFFCSAFNFYVSSYLCSSSSSSFSFFSSSCSLFLLLVVLFLLSETQHTCNPLSVWNHGHGYRLADQELIEDVEGC